MDGGVQPRLGEPANTLWKTAEAVASSVEFRFSRGCAMQLRARIIQAEEKMMAGGPPKTTDVRRAENNVERLVREMATVAREEQERRIREEAERTGRVYDEQLTAIKELDENMLNMAFLRLCPGLWPFC